MLLCLKCAVGSVGLVSPCRRALEYNFKPISVIETMSQTAVTFPLYYYISAQEYLVGVTQSIRVFW